MQNYPVLTQRTQVSWRCRLGMLQLVETEDEMLYNAGGIDMQDCVGVGWGIKLTSKSDAQGSCGLNTGAPYSGHPNCVCFLAHISTKCSTLDWKKCKWTPVQMEAALIHYVLSGLLHCNRKAKCQHEKQQLIFQTVYNKSKTLKWQNKKVPWIIFLYVRCISTI